MQSQVSKESWLAVIAFVLPFFAWLVAAVVNPNGWASENPMVVIMTIVIIAISVWPFTLFITLIAILYFVREKPPARHFTVFLMTISVIYSAYLYSLTSTAGESEFTG